MKYFKFFVFNLFLTIILVSFSIANAGDLEPSQSPASSMKTLQEVYEQTELIKSSVNDLAREVYLSNCTDAKVPKTGQFQTFSSVDNDDGYLTRGVPWPDPRFTINSDGTITDKLTGLIWLRNANLPGQAKTWSEALELCNNLADNGTTLTDGSSAGDWRLPNLVELESIINIAYYNPCISNTEGNFKWSEGSPFNNIYSSVYWSSTITAMEGDGKVWTIHMKTGVVDRIDQAGTAYVWAVRN